MKKDGYANSSKVRLDDQPNLDAIFSALADPTRRAILSQLMQGEANVQALAAPFEMSQPAISKHLKVLEKAGLIERDIDAQRRPARLKADNMVLAVDWLHHFKQFWGRSFDELDNVLDELRQSKMSDVNNLEDKS